MGINCAIVKLFTEMILYPLAKVSRWKIIRLIKNNKNLLKFIFTFIR